MPVYAHTPVVIGRDPIYMAVTFVKVIVAEKIT